MKNLKVFFFLLVLSANSFAQKPDSTYVFSIKQAIDYTLHNQKDVVNAQIDADISHYKVKETIGIGLPQINASFDLKDYIKIPTQLFPDFISPSVYGILYDENLIPTKKEPSNQLFPVQFGTQWNATAGISASQLIFDPTYLVGVNAAKTFRDLSHRNYDRTRIDAAVSVIKAYYAVLLVRERKQVIDANVERLLKLLKDTRALFENGFVEKIDLDRVQVANNNIQSESDNITRLVDNSLLTLKFQIGLPYTSNLILTDTLNDETVKNMQVESVPADPTKRIEYSILKTEELLQQYNLKRYKSEYYPSIIAYGSLNTIAQRNEFNIPETNKPWYPTTLIGATLSINIFNGMQKENHIQEEKLALRKIDNTIKNFENEVNLEVNTNRASLLYAISSLNIQSKNLDLANSVTNTAKLKYDQGVGSYLEVLDAESALKESQVNYFNALFNALLAKIDLEKALGNFNY